MVAFVEGISAKGLHTPGFLGTLTQPIKNLTLGHGYGYYAGIPDVHQDIEASPELEGIYEKLLAINGGKFNLTDQKGSIRIIQRIYPEGMGINSTDYEPHRYWGAGCQVVAM